MIPISFDRHQRHCQIQARVFVFICILSACSIAARQNFPCDNRLPRLSTTQQPAVSADALCNGSSGAGV